MQAVANETTPFPQSAQELQSYLRDIVLIVENRYPNVKTIYLSSRAYGGYAGASSPSPEPWAYEGAFAVKWLIESQINVSDPALAYDNTPWLAWGPYTWAERLITWARLVQSLEVEPIYYLLRRVQACRSPAIKQKTAQSNWAVFCF